MPRKTGRKRHIPQRTCIACREVLPKRSLIRVVRTPQGIMVDPSGKLAGRGAYVHQQKSCWNLALKGVIASALKVELTQEDKERLLSFASTLLE